MHWCAGGGRRKEKEGGRRRRSAMTFPSRRRRRRLHRLWPTRSATSPASPTSEVQSLYVSPRRLLSRLAYGAARCAAALLHLDSLLPYRRASHPLPRLHRRRSCSASICVVVQGIGRNASTTPSSSRERVLLQSPVTRRGCRQEQVRRKSIFVVEALLSTAESSLTEVRKLWN